jgi:hypothetical protein
MTTTLLTRRIRPLAIALLTALTIAGATGGVAVAASSQVQHSHSGAEAVRWCVPGSTGCPLQVQVAP